MDNLDDSENNAKISDSAYSNSCSNSQSRRSHSSKSTHSGSRSSGSSGYGGKLSTSGISNDLLPPKKDKEPKNKKLLPQIENLVPDVVVEEVRAPEPVPTFDAPKEEKPDDVPTLPPVHAQTENGDENMGVCVPELTTLKEEVVSSNLLQVKPAASFPSGRPLQSPYCTVQSKRYQEISRYEARYDRSELLRCKDGFSCVISMQDGVVMYASSTLTTSLGFPKDMWIGRSFIDFVHPRDRDTFASQITNGLALPKNVNGTQEKVKSPANSVSTMVGRIRRYRGLATGFGVKERVVAFMPFLLKLTFKNISDEDGKVIYLVIQATPFFSAYKTPNEMVIRAMPFVIRHAANGHIEYVDPQSVPYLGYLPQDLADKDVLSLYHPEDLLYLCTVYDTIVKEGGLPRSKSYRMITQNGDYIRLETEWSSFINPWSKKLEFVIGKHHILEGPTNPDVFQSPEQEYPKKFSEEEENKAQMLRENIIRTMNEALTKPAELAKQQMSQRCQDLASFMESLMEEGPKVDEELRLEIQDQDHSYYERDSVMLGGISPHHDYYDSQSSTETPLSYTQLNYNETLQRYFVSQEPESFGEYKTTGESIQGHETRPLVKYAGCLSPIAQHSRDSGEISSSDSNAMIILSRSPMPDDNYQPIRLTEALLNKHNIEMEKELMKMQRETRSSTKGDRGKNSNETRKKKKEHLARCNASFYPTSAGTTELQPLQQPHGLKRSSNMMDAESGAQKHHCPSTRQASCNMHTLTTRAAANQYTSSSTIAINQLATASNQWTPANNMSTYTLRAGIPQQMSNMSTMPHSMQPMHTMSAGPASNQWTPANNMSTYTLRAGIPQQMSNMSTMPHSMQPMHTMSAGPASNQWTPANNMSTYTLRAGIPQQMSNMSTMPHSMQPMHTMSAGPGSTSGTYPMYHAPAASQPMPTTSAQHLPSNSQQHQFQAPMMAYGHPLMGTPLLYSPMTQQVSYPMLQSQMAQSMQQQYTNTRNPLGLTRSTFDEAGKLSLTLRPDKVQDSACRAKKRAESQGTSSKTDIASADSLPSNALNPESGPHKSRSGNEESTIYSTDIRSSNNLSHKPNLVSHSSRRDWPRDGHNTQSTDAVTNTPPPRESLLNERNRLASSVESPDKTDGESSYSSFYSSFFKTESGSAEDSGDGKNGNKPPSPLPPVRSPLNATSSYRVPQPAKVIARSNMDPPRLEQVNVSSQLFYNYQVQTKSLEETLAADRQRMKNFVQPSLVNEQLGQLYQDLQLEGVTARLTLEEGIISSSSSGEETSTSVSRSFRKKRGNSTLAMIHEENAPLPPPSDDAPHASEMEPQPSTSKTF